MTTSYVVAGPGGHYHDWYSAKDRNIVSEYVVLDLDTWTRWFSVARDATSKNASESATALLPDPVSRHQTYQAAKAEVDRLNTESGA